MFFSEHSVSATPPPFLSRRSRQRERLSASELFSVRLFVRLSICLTVAKMQITRFSQKLSNLELWCLLTTFIGSYVSFTGLFKEPVIKSLQSKMAEIRHLENRHDVIFLPRVVRFG